ncbi:DUF6520 family protein [Chitinophaga sp. CF418]|uniref:DUF6520 family protein n=1 Tax=Chitinophaga sp. CF418 TaxID=1855287 RepID=UPI00091EEA09|nr:DUF6520 family protein [Chitinophaga sp. CF418]SHN45668.1 hypothetical protein SAMN05216311_1218 [Chitinophaga sp. CF418]
MKKAKIILSAIAVLAIVGGAYAFKASRSQFVGWKTTTVYYIGTNSYVTAVPFCTSTEPLTTVGVANTTLYSSTTTTSPATRTVGNGITTFTIAVPGCTNSFTTRTTLIEG